MFCCQNTKSLVIRVLQVNNVVTHPLKTKIETLAVIKWLTLKQMGTEAKLLINLKHRIASGFHKRTIFRKSQRLTWKEQDTAMVFLQQIKLTQHN